MTQRNIEIEAKTLGKAFIVLIILMAGIFILGILLGKRQNTGAVPDDAEGDMAERLSACSYKLQELTEKYSALTAMTIEKGLTDQSGTLVPGVMCTVSEQLEPPDTLLVKESKAVQPDTEPVKPAAQKTEKTASVKNEPVKPENTKEETAVKQPDKKQAAADEMKKILKELDKKEPKKEEKTKKPLQEQAKQAETSVKETPAQQCKYAIQVYAEKNMERTLAAQKTLPVKDARLVKGEVKGDIWYRLRTGCYPDRKAAEQDLGTIKAKIPKAIIVAE